MTQHIKDETPLNETQNRGTELTELELTQTNRKEQ